MRLDGIVFMRCYLTPNETIHEFMQKLHELEDAIRDLDGEVIVAGDFNSRAAEWGMPDPNRRGLLVMEIAARLNLIVLNNGGTFTFRSPGYRETITDVTFASKGIDSRVNAWIVSERYTASDHQYITFKVEVSARFRSSIREIGNGSPTT